MPPRLQCVRLSPEICKAKSLDKPRLNFDTRSLAAPGDKFVEDAGERSFIPGTDLRFNVGPTASPSSQPRPWDATPGRSLRPSPGSHVEEGGHLRRDVVRLWPRQTPAEAVLPHAFLQLHRRLRAAVQAALRHDATQGGAGP